MDEKMAFNESFEELTEEELKAAAGGNDGSENYGDGPQNIYIVNVPSSYLALRTQPAFRRENEIGEMWNGYEFQSYGQYSQDGFYVYGYSLNLRREGWTNRRYLVPKRW